MQVEIKIFNEFARLAQALLRDRGYSSDDARIDSNTVIIPIWDANVPIFPDGTMGVGCVTASARELWMSQFNLVRLAAARVDNAIRALDAGNKAAPCHAPVGGAA